MNEKSCCVVDAKGFYRAYVLVQVDNGGQTVIGYKLQASEMLIDSDTKPDTKQHAGSTGFVKPRWDEDAKAWVEGVTDEELAVWEAEHPAPAVNLDALRAAKQEQNKQALAEWLAAHPLTWTDGNVYGVTKEDQDEMNLNLAQYQLAVMAGEENPILEWHTQKKRCHSFTLAEFTALALAIRTYVYPYRQYQEAVKEAIYMAETKEELDAIQIDYGRVSAAA